MKKYQKNLICILIMALFLISGSVEAEDPDNIKLAPKVFNINADTASNPFASDLYDNAISISAMPGAVATGTDFAISKIYDDIKLPWRLDVLSGVYQYDFGKNTGILKKPLLLKFKYGKASNYLKKVYFFDKNLSAWRPLPTKDSPKEKYVTAWTNLPFSRIAIFADQEILTVGQASWYKHKTGNYAASPDFPKGSKLRITNYDNGKSVEVEVDDYGPDRIKHPARVVDLEKTAFAKIASPADGLIRVIIEPTETKKNIAKIENIELKIKAKSAIVMNENTGDVIFNKNSTSTLPLASLTKLVAVNIFLETRPTLSRIVAYSRNDENYNYKYVDFKWQSARLKVDEGETLSIEDLIYSALAGSANNAIESLIRVSGLSRNDFIKKMNDTVYGWGAQSTYFNEPTGLSPKNVSSAMDYAIITKEVFKNPIIQKASTMKEYKFKTRNTKKKHTIRNTNGLLNDVKYEITGSKTGFLDEAGHCLMTRAKAKNGNQIIVVTFGESTKADSVSETKELLNYGLKKLN